MEKQTNKEELLKAVADVLDEALAEYEKLAKWEDTEMQMVEDPSKGGKKLEKDVLSYEPNKSDNPAAQSIMNAFAHKSEEPSEEAEEAEEDKEDQASPDVAEDKDEEDKEENKDKEDEMDDDTLKSKYLEMCAKMEARGLMKKSEEVKKSEAPAADDKTETLRKSVDERFDALTKAIADISATVNKIASAPTRKGVAGYQPLRKSEDGAEQPLNKAEVISKLLDLKKSGKYVDTALINRIETGRASEADAQSIKQLLG